MFDEFLEKYYEDNKADFPELTKDQFVEQHRPFMKVVDTLTEIAIEKYLGSTPANDEQKVKEEKEDQAKLQAEIEKQNKLKKLEEDKNKLEEEINNLKN